MGDLALEKATAILQEAGVRMTPQRRVILQQLYQQHHPTVEELYRQICSSSPSYLSLSQTTIYNNLKILKQHGLVKEIYDQTAGIARYDSNLDTHHHLVCKHCDRIMDSSISFPLPLHDVEKREGFTTEDWYIELRGICQDCKQKPSVSESHL